LCSIFARTPQKWNTTVAWIHPLPIPGAVRTRGGPFPGAGTLCKAGANLDRAVRFLKVSKTHDFFRSVQVYRQTVRARRGKPPSARGKTRSYRPPLSPPRGLDSTLSDRCSGVAEPPGRLKKEGGLRPHSSRRSRGPDRSRCTGTRRSACRSGSARRGGQGSTFSKPHGARRASERRTAGPRRRLPEPTAVRAGGAIRARSRAGGRG